MANKYIETIVNLFKKYGIQFEPTKDSFGNFVNPYEFINRKFYIRGTESTVISSNDNKGYYLFIEKIKIDDNNIKSGKYGFGYMYGKNKRVVIKSSTNIKDIVNAILEELDMCTIKEALEGFIKNNVKQIIITGAPGTGKTYTARKFAKEQGDENFEFVQFHPSYDYTDFVEGLRPVIIKGKSLEDADAKEEPTFVRMDGTFKSYCRKVFEEEINDFYSTFSSSDNEKIKNLINDNKLDANKQFSELNPTEKETVFDFYKNQKIEGEREEENYKNKKRFFIIDEINRADLSRVFGELMYCLEDSYRGIENAVATQYRNLSTYKIITKGEHKGKAEVLDFDCFKDGFFIPKNLILIGTMNDIDRSVESFDFALRRRFNWICANANKEMETALKKENSFYEMIKQQISEKKDANTTIAEDQIENLKKMIENLNNIIISDEGKKFNLNEAYQIGHAYFKSYNGDNIKDIWKYKVEPILKEYVRGREAKKFIEACENELINTTNNLTDKKGESDARLQD